MDAVASIKNIRIASRKTILVANLIRNKKVSDAIIILHNLRKKSAPTILKLLNSAISNATNNFQMNGDKLFIKEIIVNEGRTLKRAIPGPKGRRMPILKRSSHIKIVVSELNNERNK